MSSTSLISIQQLKSWIKIGDNLPFQQMRIGGRLKIGTTIGKSYLERGFSIKLLGHPSEDTWEVTSDPHGTTIEDTVSSFIFSDFYITK
jgi:hypothetical protein